MRLVIKIAGALIEKDEDVQSLARQIAELAHAGNEILVVHGGGKIFTATLARMGIESRFVNGLRVTTPETVDALLKVFAGTVNHELVASLNRAGCRAVGLSGIDAFLAQAEQMDPALGAVGRITASDPALLLLLTAHGYLPVVACVAGDRAGNIYNVNADQMAVACAVAFGARRLVFLTDVDGVRDGAGLVRPVLNAAECERLIADGIATGGMQAKLQAALAALRGGVEQVVIAPGAAPDVLSTSGIGTQIVRVGPS